MAECGDYGDVMDRKLSKKLHYMITKYPEMQRHFYIDITLDERNEIWRNFEQAHQAGCVGPWWTRWKNEVALNLRNDAR